MLNLLSFNEVTQEIKNGAVGILPTDTVYGLVCSANNSQSVKRLYDLKSREHKPGTLIAASVDQLVELGFKRRFVQPVEHYWPGSISVVIPITSGLSDLHVGKYSLAVRIPAELGLRSLLEMTGPLLTSSANQPGMPPANTLKEAEQYFGDAVDFYVDGGDLSGRESSTVIRIVDDAVEVLREGAVKLKESGEIAS